MRLPAMLLLLAASAAPVVAVAQETYCRLDRFGNPSCGYTLAGCQIAAQSIGGGSCVPSPETIQRRQGTYSEPSPAQGNAGAAGVLAAAVKAWRQRQQRGEEAAALAQPALQSLPPVAPTVIYVCPWKDGSTYRTTVPAAGCVVESAE